jgi:ribosomal protein L14
MWPKRAIQILEMILKAIIRQDGRRRRRRLARTRCRFRGNNATIATERAHPRGDKVPGSIEIGTSVQGAVSNASSENGANITA